MRESLLILSVAALDLGHMEVGLGVGGVAFRDILVGREGFLVLAVLEQGVGKGAFDVEVVGFEVKRALVGGDGLFGVLDLVVAGA